jgi:hypothetical protein
MSVACAGKRRIEAANQNLEDGSGARCLLDGYRQTLPSLRNAKWVDGTPKVTGFHRRV